ncbi:RsmE family RNA methyltransferase, partial [Aegicerativicinus sediminis]
VEQQPLPYYLHILIAPTKNIDRFEWFLEKSTEIGVSEITPIICDNSERKIIKIDRCERIIESAMKQSLKSYKPKLNDLTDFQSALELFKSNQVLIAHCEPQERVLLKDVVEPSKNYTILIGPEGDFSSKEIENALSKGCKPISLGDSRLRTETAGVVACHSVNFINQ